MECDRKDLTGTDEFEWLSSTDTLPFKLPTAYSTCLYKTEKRTLKLKSSRSSSRILEYDFSKLSFPFTFRTHQLNGLGMRKLSICCDRVDN